MVEANPVKFYTAKYFFLLFALIQWLVTALLLYRFEFSNKVFFSATIFFTLGLVFFFLFLFINDKIKRVAVGKNKIVVRDGQQNLRFEWDEVKSLRIVPFFNLYKMKIKGKRNSIYFFPAKNSTRLSDCWPETLPKWDDRTKKKKDTASGKSSALFLFRSDY
jgi:hypothetical protein